MSESFFAEKLDAEGFFYYDNHDDLKTGRDVEFFKGVDGEEENDEAGDDLEYAHPYPGLGVVRDMLLATRALGSRHDEMQKKINLLLLRRELSQQL